MKEHLNSQINLIDLQERVIIYRTKFSHRAKYLRLQINNSNELEVILPRRYKHEKAEDFIFKKKNWILKHLKEKKYNKFYYFGKEISISVNYDLFLKKPFIQLNKNKLSISLPAEYNSFSVGEIYNIWLKHKARVYLLERVKKLSGKAGFAYKKITIRSQKTRWGSCSTGKELSFNYRLIKFRKEVVDYVIIHELCHLREMNHSPKFWKLVEVYCPDYKKLKQELRKV